MKVSVDKTKCIGCGACASIEPTVFRINPEDGKSEADSNACALNHKEDGCKEAASVCPVNAILIEEDDAIQAESSQPEVSQSENATTEEPKSETPPTETPQL